MKKVLVIGDSCTDIIEYGRCDRLSPEAPVPVFTPTNTTTNGGMIINVYNNLKALYIECDVITNDYKPVKSRYVDEVSNQMLLRVDTNDKIEPIERKRLEDINFNQYFAVVISDYNKGFLSEADIKYISEQHDLTFMDTKKKIGDWCSNIKFIKINEKEYNENSDYLRVGYAGNLIVTRGRDGAMLNNALIYNIENEHPVRDLSGAGDTFLAGLVAKYIKTSDIRSAIEFANKCASWVVTQKGVTVIDVDELS